MDEKSTASVSVKSGSVIKNKFIAGFLAVVVFVFLLNIKGAGPHFDLYVSFISVVITIWGYPLDGQRIKTILSAYAIMWSLFALVMLSEGPKGIALLFIMTMYLFLSAVIANYFLKILEKSKKIFI